MKIKRKNEKGFTLVEVIVVAVIVAILAAVAIPLYVGYINDANQNSVNNAAGSAASFLAAAVNAQCNDVPTTNGPPWSCTTPTGEKITFNAPDGITITMTANTVNATKGTKSKQLSWK